MKGLLMKDGYLMWKYQKVNMIIALIFSFISAFNIDGSNTNLFFIFYSCLMISFIPSGLYLVEEREKSYMNFFTLPVSRKTYVLEKYLLSVLSNTAIILLNSVILLIRTAGQSMLKDSLMMIALMTVMTFLTPAVGLPAVMKFGGTMGTFVNMIVPSFCMLLIMSVMSFDSVSDLVQYHMQAIDSMIHMDFMIFYLLITLFTFLLYGISIPLSVKIYKNKEF